MVWRTYGRVIGGLVLAGAVVVGAFFLLMPADAGEDGLFLRITVAVWGAFIGGGAGLAASAGFTICLSWWTRRTHRSVASRAWVGAAGAAIGAASLWIVIGLLWNSTYAWALWGPAALFSGLLAAVVAGPLTVRSARRVDRADVRVNVLNRSQDGALS